MPLPVKKPAENESAGLGRYRLAGGNLRWFQACSGFEDR